MPDRTATALAHPNIAFIKYWGNQDHRLHRPANASLSMNMAGLETVTTVTFSADLAEDEITLDGERQAGLAGQRVSAHLDHIRRTAGLPLKARVESRNNFPMGVGIASSASGFAALTLAGAAAAGLNLDERGYRTPRSGAGQDDGRTKPGSAGRLSVRSRPQTAISCESALGN